MTAGRPTKYKKEYCQAIIDYFANFEPFDEIPVDKQDKEGNVTTTMKKVPAMPPSLTKFGTSIGVHFDTLLEWREKHPEFSVSYRQAKKIYEDTIRDGAVIGLYKENFTKMVMAQNFGWSDKQQVDNNLSFPQGIEVNFTKPDEDKS